MPLKSARTAAVVGVSVLAAGGVTAARATTTTSHTNIAFTLQRSAASATAGCLVGAGAKVKVVHRGQVEEMTIDAAGLPKNTDFDVFITQLPNAPFGVSWYQGDLETNAKGTAHVKFVGRFSVETFAVAPGPGPAPVVHNTGTIRDAAVNPPFAPIHEYHVGVWFNSAASAAASRCTNVVTPFNGDHTAGPQALSSNTFADTSGPLRQLTP
jgi:hypothetical protein